MEYPPADGLLQRFGTRAYRNGGPFWFGNVSRDGRWLVSGSTHVDLWDLRDGSRRKIRDLAHNTVPRPTLSPDGKIIAVLDGGTFVGLGRHKELLVSCPTYAEIVASQLSAQEAA